MLGDTIENLMHRMSALEFEHWRAEHLRSPFGNDIDNYRAGAVASAVVNVHATKKSQLTRPSDFYLVPPTRKPVLTQKQQRELEKRRHGHSRNSHS